MHSGLRWTCIVDHYELFPINFEIRATKSSVYRVNVFVDGRRAEIRAPRNTLPITTLTAHNGFNPSILVHEAVRLPV